MNQSRDEHFVVDLLAPEIGEMLQDRRVAEARSALAELLDPEVADVILALPFEQRPMAFRLLPRERAADVFPYLPRSDQEQLVDALSDRQLAGMFDEMDPDDRVEFLEDVPEALVEQLLGLMNPEERDETARLLDYPEQSIGRLVTPDYLTIGPQWTVREALEKIREQGADAETLHTLYVVDDAGQLLDHVRLRHLVLASPDEKVESLRQGQTVSLRATEDREEAVRVMERYDLPVLPVVDDDDKLVGIVTFDDVADVAEEEVTEDIQKIGGMAALEEPYVTASVLKVVRARAVWLLILFAGGLLTVWAMGGFKDSIERYVVLALFVPLIIASGGNSGSQAASLIIRSLAIGEIKVEQWFSVLRRELVSGFLLGVLLGVFGALAGATAAVLIDAGDAPALSYGLAIGTSVVGVVLIGTLTGSMLPLLLERIGLDPATSSTPFVATIVDVAGLLLYFACAMAILGL